MQKVKLVKRWVDKLFEGAQPPAHTDSVGATGDSEMNARIAKVLRRESKRRR